MVDRRGARFLLAACALSGSLASAQSANLPPSPTPASQAPMTAAGLRLPLRGEESVVELVHGCGMLSPVRPGPSLLNIKKGTWVGACRFGLMHGAGIERWIDRNSYAETEYRYGIGLNGRTYIWLKSGNSWNRNEVEVYRAYNRPGNLMFNNWSLPADKVDSNIVQLRRLTFGDVPGNQSNYGQASLHCGGAGAKVDREILSHFTADEQKQVVAACRNASNRLNYIKYEKTETLIEGATFPDGKNSRVTEVRHHLCASLVDCRQAWDNATAAEWPEIQRRKADWIAAQNAAIADWQRRMAPLETAFAAKLRRYAARPRKAR
jgi:hypothetical protein